MKKIISLLLLFVAVIANAQMMEPVKFKADLKTGNTAEAEIIFTATVDAGWHVYSTDPGAEGPIPATITFVKKDGVELVGKLKPVGNLISHMDDMFGAELKYFENSAKFVQRIKFTKDNYDIDCYLEYGACNDQMCLPPTTVDFAKKGKSPVVDGKEAKEEKVEEPVAEEVVEEPVASEADSLAAAPVAVPAKDALWAPVIDELRNIGNDTPTSDNSLWKIFLMGLMGGFIALFTPCVWPIIPMTVSFFLKRNKDSRKKGIRDAMTYGLSIIVIYLLLGFVITLIWGASALNALSTNAVFNIFFCMLLLLFGASFLGGFEIVLPSKWTNAVDNKASATTGLLSIFLMAFTLALVSFSCTGPIIGLLLVEMTTSNNFVGPAVGMFGFALALALPFTLFAIFPTWLKSAPKSGNWMNVIKVTLGFIELAFALKFFSVADLAYGWHLLDREVFLSLWIVLFALLGAYLIGWIRFPHDEDEYNEMGEVVVNHRTSVVRFFMALVSFAFAIYMVPGLWGAPCKAVSAFAPPMSTQDFNLAKSEAIEGQYKDYEMGMQYAASQGKPVMIDFTGFGCVNCRKMEAAVWTDERVKKLITEDYVLIQLFVDDKTPLPEPLVVDDNGTSRTLRTVGDKWSYLQRSKFGCNTQPTYVLLNNEGKPLNTTASYDEDIDKYINFLETGLKNYKR